MVPPRFLVAASLGCLAVLVPTASATHEEDGAFDQQVVLNWDTPVIDVLVVPATAGQPGNPSDLDPLNNSMRRGVASAIQDWESAIDRWGSEWLRQNVVLRVHWAASGVPPVQDPEIVVLHEDAGGGFAQAVNNQNFCDQYGCASVGPICIAHAGPIATRMFDPVASRNVHAHEIGHCLGLAHPGDPNVTTSFHPDEDIMSYGGKPDPVHCISNMNVLGLDAAFAHLHGGSRQLNVSLAVESYIQTDCNENGHPVRFDGGTGDQKPSGPVPIDGNEAPATSTALVACMVVVSMLLRRRLLR